MNKLKIVIITFSIVLLMGVTNRVNVYATEYSNVYEGRDYSDVFDYEYYYNRYPDLQRVLGKDYDALLRHFISSGMEEGRRGTEYFDVYNYMYRYSDLQDAFGDDLKAYYLHYLYAGKNEGRIASDYVTYKDIDYSDVFDYEYYYNKYSDLQDAIGYNPQALISHFINNGMTEGRMGNDEFDIDFYRNRYPDLRNAFGNDNIQYYLHYIYSGKAEGRKPVSDSYYGGVDYSKVYDKNFYYNNYADLRNAFGDNPRALIKHFVDYGMCEGRQASATFDYSYYRRSYSDLNDAFKDDKSSYYYHFIGFGYNEGRLGVPSTWVTTSNGKMYYVKGEPVTGWQKIGTRQYFFNDKGILISKTGIDVSRHDGDIDWQKVKDDGIEFAIIRVGYGGDYLSQDDIKAAYNMDECERLGIPYGVYLYSYSLELSEVEEEIAHTLRMIQGRNPVMGVYFDMEDADGYKQDHGMPSKEILNDMCIKYVQGITDAGYKAGVYASKYWFTNTLTNSTLDEYLKWVAQWSDKNTYEGKFDMWQYTSNGSVNGIGSRVDMNVYLGEIPQK